MATDISVAPRLTKPTLFLKSNSGRTSKLSHSQEIFNGAHPNTNAATQKLNSPHQTPTNICPLNVHFA